MFEETLKNFGSVDILINNAGICPITMVKDMSYEEWKSVIDVNLSGTFLTNREMVNTLISLEKPGVIINIVSPAAFIGSKNGKSHYSASKGGVLSFSISLAKEVAKYGIRVNALAPGMLYTEMTAKTLDAQMEQYTSNIPIGRIGQVDEIANAVTFGASEKSGYVTGALIDVSGGLIGR
jgi:3-oxoacyl-[acyl-carrier protein] reductase